jgi:single-strand DNA-binding protein
MSSFNRVILLGHLTRDAEMRYTPKGTVVAKLSLAVNRQWKDDAGQKREEVAFVDCTAWGKRAEVICQYTRKGLALLIEGYLKQESWDDKQTGQKRTKLVVNVENFSLIQFADREQEGRPAPDRETSTATRGRSAAEQVKAGAASDNDGPPPDDDDVPF